MKTFSVDPIKAALVALISLWLSGFALAATAVDYPFQTLAAAFQAAAFDPRRAARVMNIGRDGKAGGVRRLRVEGGRLEGRGQRLERIVDGGRSQRKPAEPE